MAWRLLTKLNNKLFLEVDFLFNIKLKTAQRLYGISHVLVP